MAKAINQVYSTNEVKQNETNVDAPPIESSMLDEHDFEVAMAERLHCFDLLFTKSTSTDWIVVFANTPHYDIQCDLHHENYISITVKGDKPSLQSLQSASSVTGIRPDEWGFEEIGQFTTSFRLYSPFHFFN